MKKILLQIAIYACILGGILHAQPLTGTRTVGGFSPNYLTISAAINDLNINGVGPGGVIFEVAAGHTETASGILITTNTSSSTSPIVIRKSGVGANPLITATAGTSTTLDFVIGLLGTDFVTIEEINILDPTANNTNTLRMEFGIALFKQNTTNGCNNVTIKGCTISMQRTNTASRGIQICNHTNTATTALTISAPSGIHNNINIIDNSIISAYTGIFQIGSTSTLYFDDSLTISGNTIRDIGSTTTAAYGIYHINYRNVNIYNNDIRGSASQNAICYGIFTTTATGANILVRRNFVRLNPSNTTTAAAGIYNTGGAVSGMVTIDSNIVDSCMFNSATTGAFYGIWHNSTAINVRINNNQITRNRRTATTGVTYYIYNQSGTNIQVNNNIVNDNISTGGTTGVTYGIFSNGTNVEVANNTISNLQRNASTTSDVAAIYTSTGTNHTYARNRIFNISSTSSAPVLHGIRVGGILTESTHNIINNLISNITITVSNANNSVNGITVNTAAIAEYNVFHNTIHLNTGPGTGNFGSNAINMNTTPAINMANNILHNVSQSSGTGRTVAYRRSSNSAVTHSNFSDNNLLYAGVPSINNLLYADNINSLQNISDVRFFFRAGGREVSSVSEPINFLSTVGTSPDFLKLDPLVGTQTESGGKFISNIFSDFESDTARLTFPKSGQINGGGSAPDLGAYEQDLIPTDSAGPAIVFTPLRNGSVFTSRLLQNVRIQDKSGVRMALGERPKIYFKRSYEQNILPTVNNSTEDGWKFVEGTHIGNNFYDFTIDYSILLGGILLLNDTIQYFIVARDSSIAQNISINGADLAFPAFSTTLSSAQFPVTNLLYSYIIDTALDATYTVGGTGVTDFTSLTRSNGLFNAINNGIVTGNIVVNIVSDVTNEDGTVMLEELQTDGPNPLANLIIIKPVASGTTVSGTAGTGGLIKLRNTSNVIFDGEATLPHAITYKNNATSGANSTFQIIGLAGESGCSNITIQNCIISNNTRGNFSAHGVYIGGATITTANTSGGFGNNRIRLFNNIVRNTTNGITVISHPTSLADSFAINFNQIGFNDSNETVSSIGLRLNGVTNSIIHKNRFLNIVSSNINLTTVYGIDLAANCRNLLIDGNDIDRLAYTNTRWNTLRGINIAGTPNANVVLSNNVIKRIVGSGYDFSISNGPVGIHFSGTGNNYSLFNNTIVMSGTRPLNSWVYVYYYTYSYDVANPYTSTVAVASTAISGLDIRNNVFSNVQNSARATNPGFNFAFHSTAPASSYTYFGNNLLFANSTNAGMFNGLFFSGTITAANFAQFKQNIGDQNSIWGMPPYSNDTVFTVNPLDTNIWNIKGRGFPLVQVGYDADSNTRSTSILTGATDIGAYNIDSPLVAPPAAIASAAPAANTTTAYLFRGDTLATIFWKPLSAVPSQVEVRQFTGVNPPLSNNGTNQMNTYWDIDGISNSGYDVDINLHYNRAHMGTVLSDTNMIAAHTFSSLWDPLPLNSSINTSRRILTVANYSNLGQFTGTDPLNPIPVTLTSFTAKRKDMDAELIWITASEVNSQKAVVERSFNRVDFEEIASYRTKNTNRTTVYEHMDLQVIRRANAERVAVIYYRIKFVDRDGSFAYSPVRTISVQQNDRNTIVVSPNPFDRDIVLNLQRDINSNVELRLLDVSGREVYQQTISLEAGTDKSITLPNKLKNGIYFLEMKYDGEREVQKLIKKD
jgi:hypothetical protein